MSELSNRMAKANRLLETIFAAGGTAAKIAIMGPTEWQLAELAAGVKPASSKTREMVKSFAEIRERIAKEDPFARMKD